MYRVEKHLLLEENGEVKIICVMVETNMQAPRQGRKAGT